MPRIFLGIALLFCAALAGAADIPAALAGKWTMTGHVNIDAEPGDETMGDDSPKMDAVFAADTITMTMGDSMTIKMTWKVLAEKPEGIDIEVTGGYMGTDKKHKSQLVVLNDGIAILQNEHFMRGMRFGMKFVRADGKPIGLPPSTQPAKKPEAVVDPTSAEIAKQFSSQIEQITLGRTISFEDGDLSAPKVASSSQIQLQVSWPKELTVIKQNKAAVLVEAVTDTGESLIPTKKRDRDQHFFGGNVYNNQTDITLPIASPTKPAKAITTLRLTVSLGCEKKAATPLEFKGIKEWVGKDKPLSVGGKSVTIVSVEGTELKYSIEGNPDEVIKSVVIRDAAGKVLPSGGGGWSGDNETYTCTVHARKPIPDDATVQFIGVGEITVVELPITIKDIPLTYEAAAALGGAALF